jgi:poly(hydroxyalkanoate) granule-associated protein
MSGIADPPSSLEAVARQAGDTGRKLWLASLGAIAVLEAESKGLFDRLVERGRPLAARPFRAGLPRLEAIGEARERARKLAGEARDLAHETLDYEARRALERLGVMTRDDLTALSSRLETLSGRIDAIAADAFVGELEGSEPAPIPPAAPATTAAPRARARRRKPQAPQAEPEH